MKYARIQKDATSWPMLVGFPDTVTRSEQRIRFGYEFPEGTWDNMGYYEARMNGFGMRHWTDDKLKQVELCDGRVFPAILTNRTYKELAKAEKRSNDSDIRSVEEYYCQTGDRELYVRNMMESIKEIDEDNLKDYLEFEKRSRQKLYDELQELDIENVNDDTVLLMIDEFIRTVEEKLEEEESWLE